MSVSSYLELYLAIFGWYMFDEIWEVLKATGIAYLPFIGMFIRNIALPIKSQEAKDAAGTSLRRIEVDLVAMMTVIVLAAQPIITLDFAGLNYIKACSGDIAKVGDSDTTYSNAFGISGSTSTLNGRTVQVPVWWYGVLAISGGINNAIIVRIPCDTDLRYVRYSLNNSRIQSAKLRMETEDFMRECYKPALNKYLYKGSDKNTTDDIAWPGSTYFINEFYGDSRSKSAIVGFPYDKSRDLESETDDPLPKFGKPTCREWWTGKKSKEGGDALRDKLISQIDVSVIQDLARWGKLGGNGIGATKVSTEAAEELAIRTLVINESVNFKGLDDPNPYRNVNQFGVSGGVAAVGLALESSTFFPKIYLLKMVAPIIQAMILMMTYLLLPFILVFSSYKIGTMIFMSIVIFSIKFWTVLWAIAFWLDTNLLKATSLELLSTTSGLEEIKKILGEFITGTGANTLMSDVLISFVVGIMYVVFPLFWTGALSWAGFEIGRSITESTDKMSRPSASAGEQGGNRATKKAR